MHQKKLDTIVDLRKNKNVFVNQSKNQLKTKRKIESQFKKNKTVLLKKNILKIVGHNSGPTQEQNVFVNPSKN